MSIDESQTFSQQRIRFSQPPKSFAGKLISLILGVAFLALALMFSVVALAVIAIGGLAVWGWLWWKTRAIRKQIREQSPIDTGSDETGRIIEGEVIREAGNSPPSGYLPR